MISATPQNSWWQQGAQWIVRLELLWLALAAPFLLFPSRWTPLAALLLLGLPWLARWLAAGRLTVATPLNTPLVLLLGLTLVGFSVSAAPDLSADKLWGILLQVALYFAVVNSITTERALLVFTAFFLVGVSGLALFSLVSTDWSSVRLWEMPQIYEWLPQLDLNRLGIRGSILIPGQSLINPRQVGGVLGALLPFAFLLTLSGQVWWLRLAAALALLSGGVVLLLSQALMGWFGFVVALLAILLWRWRWLFWPLLLLGLALVAVGWRWAATNGWADGQLVAARLLDVSDVAGAGIVLRLDMWSRALAMIRDMPFTGIGLNTFPLVQSHFYTGYLIGPEPHAHSLWLQLVVDLGLPGLLLFLWFLAAFFYMSSAAYARQPGRLAHLVIVGSTAGVLAYVASGTLDVVTLGAKPLAAWWAMIGLTGAIWSQTEAITVPRPAWRTLLPAGGVLLLLLLSVWLLPQARWRNQGLLLGQQAVVAARQSGPLPSTAASAALAALDQAVRRDPEQAQLWGMRGSLYAWLGEPEAAYADLARRVQLDGRQPWPTYAPFLAWSALLAGQDAPDKAEDLLQIYTRWLNRFPQRAETYAMIAVLHQTVRADPAAAQAVLQRGLAANAQPASLLTYGQAHSEELSLPHE